MAHTTATCFDLTQKLLPVMRDVSVEFVIFQQVGACETIGLLEWETNTLFSSDPNNPHLTKKYIERSTARDLAWWREARAIQQVLPLP